MTIVPLRRVMSTSLPRGMAWDFTLDATNSLRRSRRKRRQAMSRATAEALVLQAAEAASVTKAGSSKR